MIEEHGLISVGTLQQETLPNGAKLFLSVEGVLRRVKKIMETSRGLRAFVRMPSGIRRVPVTPEILLVVAYCDLATELAAPIIKRSRIVGLPLRELPQVNITSKYAGLHCG